MSMNDLIELSEKIDGININGFIEGQQNFEVPFRVPLNNLITNVHGTTETNLKTKVPSLYFSTTGTVQSGIGALMNKNLNPIFLNPDLYFFTFKNRTDNLVIFERNDGKSYAKVCPLTKLDNAFLKHLVLGEQNKKPINFPEVPYENFYEYYLSIFPEKREVEQKEETITLTDQTVIPLEAFKTKLNSYSDENILLYSGLEEFDFFNHLYFATNSQDSYKEFIVYKNTYFANKDSIGDLTTKNLLLHYNEITQEQRELVYRNFIKKTTDATVQFGGARFEIKYKDYTTKNIFDGTSVTLNFRNISDKISEINQNLNLFYAGKNQVDLEEMNFLNIFNQGVHCIQKINNFILTNYSNKPIDYFGLNLIFIILKIPLDLYKLLDKHIGLEISNKSIEILYKEYPKWLRLCCETHQVDIYKYGYLLLMSSLLKIDSNSGIDLNRNHNMIIDEFLIDVNKNPVVDIKIFDDIEFIKSKLHQIRVWYWDNVSFDAICTHVYSLLKSLNGNSSEQNSVGLHQGFFAGYFPNSSDLVRSEELYFDGILSNRTDRNNIKFSLIPSIRAGVLHEVDGNIFLNRYQIEITKEACCFMTFDKSKFSGQLTEKDKIIILLQFVHSCKIDEPLKTNFPYELPYTTVCKLECVYNDYKLGIVCEYQIRTKYLGETLKRIENQYTTTLENGNYNFLNAFKNFVDSSFKDVYLNGNVMNPFICYGINKSGVPSEQSYLGFGLNLLGSERLVSLDYSSPTLDKFVIRENMLELINLNKGVFNRDLNKKTFSIYLFLYLYVCSADDTKSIFESFDFKKLFTFEEIDKMYGESDEVSSQRDSNENNLISKAICLSNLIKYYLNQPIENRDNILCNSILEFKKTVKTIIELYDTAGNKKLKKTDKPLAIEYVEYERPYIHCTNKVSDNSTLDNWFSKLEVKKSNESYKYTDLVKYNSSEISGYDWFYESFSPHFENFFKLFDTSKLEGLFAQEEIDKCMDIKSNEGIKKMFSYNKETGKFVFNNPMPNIRIFTGNDNPFGTVDSKPNVGIITFRDLVQFNRDPSLDPLLNSLKYVQLSETISNLEETGQEFIRSNNQLFGKLIVLLAGINARVGPPAFIETAHTFITENSTFNGILASQTFSEIYDLKLSDFFESVPIKEFTSIELEKEESDPVENPKLSLLKLIELNLYNFISSSKTIYYNDALDEKYRMYQGIEEKVYCNYNFNDVIKKIYVGKENNGHRNVYIKGSDLFQLYSDEDIVKLFNTSSPDESLRLHRVEDEQGVKKIAIILPREPTHRNSHKCYDRMIKQMQEKYKTVCNSLTTSLDSAPGSIDGSMKYSSSTKRAKLFFNNQEVMFKIKDSIESNFGRSNDENKGTIAREFLEPVTNRIYKGILKNGKILFTELLYTDIDTLMNTSYFFYEYEQRTLRRTLSNKLLKDSIRFDTDVFLYNFKGEPYKLVVLQHHTPFTTKISNDGKDDVLYFVSPHSSNIILIYNLTKFIELRINMDDQTIVMNSKEHVVTDFEKIDWGIKKWYSNRMLLYTDENLDQSEPAKYYLRILETVPIESINDKKNILSFKLNSNTKLPIISSTELLIKICKIYVSSKNIMAIIELIPLIVKFGIDVDELFGEFMTKVGYFIDHYKITNPIFSGELEYLVKYKLLSKEVVECGEKRNDYYYNYLFPIDPLFKMTTFAEYMLVSLQSYHYMKDYAFSMMYWKLQKEYRDINTVIEVKEDEHGKYCVCNPVELYYQYVFGYFATVEQLTLADEIFTDITKNKIVSQVGGFYMNKYTKIKPTNFDKRSQNARIHNLVMGGGKTSFITPLVILKYLQYLTSRPDEIANNQKCYIVLPEALVEQSYNNLLDILTLYFPVIINMCVEERVTKKSEYPTFLETLDDNPSGISSELRSAEFRRDWSDRHLPNPGENLRVYIVSDKTLKCAFINDYEKIRINNNNNVYLFDETDTILNPIISELNYPEGTREEIERLNSFFRECLKIFFTPIFCIYYMIYNRSDSLIDMLKNYENDYNMSPHFHVINPKSKLIDEIKSWAKKRILKYFCKHSTPLNTIIYNFFNSDLDNFVTDDRLISSVLFFLYDFINVVLPATVCMVNRKDYGVEDLLAIPFSYNDVPCIGSDFSNPIITICLTMSDYILQKKSLNKKIKELSVEYIINKYHEDDDEFRDGSEISKLYKECVVSDVAIADLENMYQLSEDDLTRLCKNEYIIHELCFKVCIENIVIDSSKKTISGIDLFMGFNIKNRSGFSGTVNIPEIFDILSEDDVKVVEDEKSKNTIMEVLQQCEIIITRPMEILDSIKHILHDLSIKVIIDVSGLFVGITWFDIYNIILEVTGNDHTKFRQFIYWDGDTAMTIGLEGISSTWNKQEHQNTYYYYDHRHTTGTDAKIVPGTVGAAYLSNTSRYRDAVQGIYRLRKLASREHSIKFIIDEKLSNYIEEVLRLNGKQADEQISIDQLIEWFIIEENVVFEKQKVLSTAQNISSLDRHNNRSFDSRNMYILPDDMRDGKDIILGIKTIESIDLDTKLERIEFVRKAELLSNYTSARDLVSEYNTQSTTLTQTQTQTQAQKTRKDKKLPRESPDLPPDEKVNIIFSYDDYFSYSEDKYFDMFENQTLSKIIHTSKNIPKFDVQYPAHVVFVNENYFVIPTFEGFRLIDFLKHNERNDYCIFDTTGAVYITKLNEKITEESKSFMKMIMIKYDMNVKLTLTDYINFIKYIHSKDPILGNDVIAYVMSLKDLYSSSFIKALEYYKNYLREVQDLSKHREDNDFSDYFSNRRQNKKILQRFLC